MHVAESLREMDGKQTDKHHGDESHAGEWHKSAQQQRQAAKRLHGSHDIGHQIRCRDADLREHAENEPVSLEVEQFRNPVKHEREAESDAHGYRCESVA